MAQRTIAVVIKVENAGAVTSTKEVVDALKSLEATTQSNTQWQDQLTKGFIKGNLAARAISISYGLVKDAFLTVLKSGIDLEFALTKIEAISGESSETIGYLGETINSLALSSNKSSVEIAKAALEMNKMGLSVPSIKMLLESVTALSTAFDEDLQVSAQAVVSILNVYGENALQGKKRTEELAYTVGASALTMNSFATAFAYVGATAATANVKFEDLAAAMDVLSNSGVRASTIGTQLRRIIADLSNEHSKASKSIGGTIESLGGLIPALERLKQVTPKGEEGIAFLTEKFGRTATSVAAILELNIEEMKKLSSETDNTSGSLRKQQELMSGTWSGQWEHFLNNMKSLSVLLLPIKAGLIGINEILDGTSNIFSRLVKFQHEFLTSYETKQSVSKGGGFGDLKVADQENLNKQLKETAKLLKEIPSQAEKGTLPDLSPTKETAKQKKDRLAAFAQGIRDESAKQDLAGVGNPRGKNPFIDNQGGNEATRKADERGKLWEEQTKQINDFSASLFALKVSFDAVDSASNIWGNSFAHNLVELKNPLDGFKANFKSFAQSIIAEISRMIVKMLIMKAIMLGIGLLSGGAGAGIIAGGAIGGEATGMGVGGLLAQTAASGTNQVVDRPTLFMAGEAGREHVQVTPRAKMSSRSSGDIHVHIQGDVYGGEKFQEAIQLANAKMRKNLV